MTPPKRPPDRPIESPTRRRRRSSALEMIERDIRIMRTAMTRIEERLNRLRKISAAADKLKEVL